MTKDAVPKNNRVLPVGDDTVAYRRELPHLTKRDKTYFVTFSTFERSTLNSHARDLALDACIHDHASLCWMHCAIVMPDHVHLLVTPYAHCVLHVLLRRIKGVSGYRINQLRGCHGRVWQRESFDHILRNDEKLREKAEYMLANPVRAGLVTSPEKYLWWWRAESR